MRLVVFQVWVPSVVKAEDVLDALNAGLQAVTEDHDFRALDWSAGVLLDKDALELRTDR